MPEQIAEQRMTRVAWLLHQQRGALLAQRTQAERGGFQVGIDGCADAQELSFAFELVEEAAEVVVAHEGGSVMSGIDSAAPSSSDRRL
jgi:hypothetical protein